jgi:hypothetical protein
MLQHFSGLEKVYMYFCMCEKLAFYFKERLFTEAIWEQNAGENYTERCLIICNRMIILANILCGTRGSALFIRNPSIGHLSWATFIHLQSSLKLVLRSSLNTSGDGLILPLSFFRTWSIVCFYKVLNVLKLKFHYISRGETFYVFR